MTDKTREDHDRSLLEGFVIRIVDDYNSKRKFPEAKTVLISRNGFQWSGFTILTKEEIEKLIEALEEFK